MAVEAARFGTGSEAGSSLPVQLCQLMILAAGSMTMLSSERPVAARRWRPLADLWGTTERGGERFGSATKALQRAVVVEGAGVGRLLVAPVDQPVEGEAVTTKALQSQHPSRWPAFELAAQAGDETADPPAQATWAMHVTLAVVPDPTLAATAEQGGSSADGGERGAHTREHGDDRRPGLHGHQSPDGCDIGRPGSCTGPIGGSPADGPAGAVPRVGGGFEHAVRADEDGLGVAEAWREGR